MNRRLIIIVISVILLIAVLAWLFIVSSKPLSGEVTLQEGRNHVPEGSRVDYKFSPPTSGDHFSSWITKGFYDTPRFEGNLVHSGEHGYIIIWYDCQRSSQSALFKTVYAQEMMNPSSSPVPSSAPMQMRDGSEGSPSAALAQMPKAFSDGSCNELKKQLKEVYNTLGPHKIIVVPRSGMDHKVILTAWGRTEKLDNVDQKRIKEFINSFRDAGPEHTIEP